MIDNTTHTTQNNKDFCKTHNSSTKSVPEPFDHDHRQQQHVTPTLVSKYNVLSTLLNKHHLHTKRQVPYHHACELPKVCVAS